MNATNESIAYWVVPVDTLLEALAAQGFPIGVDSHLLVLRYLDYLRTRPDATLDTLKTQLATLFGKTPAQQAQFELIFDRLAECVLPDRTPTPETDQATEKPSEPPSATLPPPTADTGFNKLPPPTDRTTLPSSRRPGPVQVRLQFPPNPLRLWNTADIDQALPSLREKEWTEAQDWDIAASIRRTLRLGGYPSVVRQRRKAAPQYILLIDQRSPRDHLAQLYAALARELERRDTTAHVFFYDRIPYRCWRVAGKLDTYTDVEGLQSQYPNHRLLICGEPNGLLEMPWLRPSSLAIELRQNWPHVGFLSTRPTPDWDNSERALNQLFPVVPANGAGLKTLVTQWETGQHFTLDYWKLYHPDVALLQADWDEPEEADRLVARLERYLGKTGFPWLCAVSVYPELYWELTTLLNDEAIPPQPEASQWDLNRIWRTALLRMSRLPWFRQGRLPHAIRQRLVKRFETLPAEQRLQVRTQILEVLERSPAPPAASYAAANYAHQMAYLRVENAREEANWLKETQQPVGEMQQFQWQEAHAAWQVALEKVDVADIADPLGRSQRLLGESLEKAATQVPNFEQIQQQQSNLYTENVPPYWPAPPTDGYTHILWVDDEPRGNAAFQEKTAEHYRLRYTNVPTTDAALAALRERGFHYIFSDIGRSGDREAGLRMLERFRKEGIQALVGYFTTPENRTRHEAALRRLGPVEIFSGWSNGEAFLKKATQRPESALTKRIEALIAEGETEKALEVLVENDREGSAKVLLEEYKKAQAQLKSGEVDQDNWWRTVSRINYSALDLLKTFPTDAPPPSSYAPKRTAKEEEEAIEELVEDNLEATTRKDLEGILKTWHPESSAFVQVRQIQSEVLQSVPEVRYFTERVAILERSETQAIIEVTQLSYTVMPVPNFRPNRTVQRNELRLYNGRWRYWSGEMHSLVYLDDFLILWLDSAPQNVQGLRHALMRQLNANFHLAENVEQAIAFIQKVRYHLIISSYLLEDKRTGFDLLAYIRERKIATPVFFFTSKRVEKEHGEALRKAGATNTFIEGGDLLEGMVQILRPTVVASDTMRNTPELVDRFTQTIRRLQKKQEWPAIMDLIEASGVQYTGKNNPLKQLKQQQFQKGSTAAVYSNIIRDVVGRFRRLSYVPIHLEALLDDGPTSKMA